ncbi:MAG: hypothetical protein NT145_08280 [Elusimicrobia bacterium]|nr:hypothetical protein [Elusimicrobiota bacterium]
MIKKVILLLESPFNKRDYKRFGIEILQQNGFKVEVWDLSPVFYPKMNLIPPDPVEFHGLRIFKNKAEVNTALKELTSDDMIITWFVYPRFFWLYKGISRSKARYSSMVLVSVPPYYGEGNSPAKKSLFNRILNVLKRPQQLISKIIFIKNKIFTSIPYKCLSIKPIAFWFAAVADNLKTNLFPCDKTTKVVFLHVFDYDLYLEKQKKISVNYENNAVFLDLYAPFHEDNDICGLPQLITAEKYYPSLCKFFDYVEKEQSTKVDIAAHPRSHYNDHPDYFNKRTLRVGQTIEMVRDAKFVITHDSASFNFAIMYYKPMIFIITEEMVRNNLTAMVYNMASWFGKKPINIDKPYCIDWEKELTVNKLQYDKYIKTFIKTEGTEQKYAWEIVADKLKTEA